MRDYSNLFQFHKNNKVKRHINSFVNRHRRLTKRQKYALDNYWSLIGVNFSKNQLDFIQLFNCNLPVTLEIGFGMGTSLVDMAKEYPQQNFLGIETYSPGVGSCLALAHENYLENLRIIHHDSVEVLHEMIPNNSLNKVQLYFPDPWHKTRHKKRRIIQISFTKLIKNKLKLNGILHIITDCKSYAEHILKIISLIEGYENYSINNNYVKQLLPRPITKFEQRALMLGHSIWELIFEKVK